MWICPHFRGLLITLIHVVCFMQEFFVEIFVFSNRKYITLDRILRIALQRQ